MTNQNSTWSYVYDMIETTSLRELVHPHGLCLSLEKKRKEKTCIRAEPGPPLDTATGHRRKDGKKKTLETGSHNLIS